MGLGVRTLLQRYFYLDEVKAALADIGETSSGNKSQLISQLIATWESHNRDLYGLLDFLDIQTLRIICKDYGLDHEGDRTILLRRIKRSNLIGSAKNRSIRTETESPPADLSSTAPGVQGLRRLRFEWPLWISIVLTVLLYFVLPLFGLTETITQVVAAVICFIGVWSGLRYLSEKR